MGSRSTWPAYMALFAVYFFWGTTYLGIRMALEAFPPILLVGLRFVISGGLMLLGAKLLRAKLPKGKELRLTALYGIITLGGGNGTLVISEQWIPSGIAALFITTSPFWMVGIDAFRKHGDKISRWTMAGIGIGFLGIVVLVGPAAMGTGIGPALIHAFLILQFGCFCWCLGSVLQKGQPTEAHPVVSGAVQQFATGIAILPISLFVDQHPVNWGSRGVWAVVYLVIFGSIVGYSAFVYAMEHLPVPVVSTYAYVNPIVAVALGWLFYREPFGFREGVAMALVLTGVVVVKYFGRATPRLGGVCLVVLAVLLLAAAAVNPLELVQAAVDLSVRTDHLRERYSLVQETISRSPGKESRKTYEIKYQDGKPYRRHTMKDGETVDGKFESFTSSEPKRLEMLQELPKALDDSFVGEERVGQYDCWVLYAKPKPGYKPGSLRSSFLTQMEAKAWIAKEHNRMIRLDAKTIGPVSFGGFLAKLSPGTRIYLEQVQVDSEVWLPSRFKMTYDGRILFKTLKGEIEQLSSNFRRVSPTT